VNDKSLNLQNIKKLPKFQNIYNEYYNICYKKIFHKRKYSQKLIKVIKKKAYILTVNHIRNNGIQSKLFLWIPNLTLYDYKNLDNIVINKYKNLDKLLLFQFQNEADILLKNKKLTEFIKN